VLILDFEATGGGRRFWTLGFIPRSVRSSPEPPRTGGRQPAVFATFSDDVDGTWPSNGPRSPAIVRDRRAVTRLLFRINSIKQVYGGHLAANKYQASPRTNLITSFDSTASMVFANRRSGTGVLQERVVRDGVNRRRSYSGPTWPQQSAVRTLDKPLRRRRTLRGIELGNDCWQRGIHVGTSIQPCDQLHPARDPGRT